MDDQQSNNPQPPINSDEPDSVLPEVQQTAPTDQSQGSRSQQDSPADDAQTDTGSALQLRSDQPMDVLPIPEEAGDNDLIEKEWVLKAKQIVEHTAEDPFNQQEELSKMKAEYLKKRYNKDLGATSD